MAVKELGVEQSREITNNGTRVANQNSGRMKDMSMPKKSDDWH